MTDKVVIKWNKESHTIFTAEHGEFIIIVDSPKWFITRGDEAVDHYLFHSPTYNELSTKIQAEKALNKLLITQQ